MQAKHTPGPWVYRQSFDARRDIWTATDATGHRELVATIPDADGDHVNADARLIAAAPELLELVLDALDDPDVDILGSEWARDARAAIAKATGAA